VSRRQRIVDGDLASPESPFISLVTSQSRESSGKDWQRSAAQRVCACALVIETFSRSALQSRGRYLVSDARRCHESVVRERACFTIAPAMPNCRHDRPEGQPYSRLESQPHPWEREAIERHRIFALAAAASMATRERVDQAKAKATGTHSQHLHSVHQQPHLQQGLSPLRLRANSPTLRQRLIGMRRFSKP